MKTCNNKVSDTWLDVQIPSFPCTPSCLTLTSDASILSIAPREYRLPKIRAAVEFLQEENEYLGAAESGEVDYLQRFLSVEGVDIQQINQLGRNALHLAIISENEKAIRILAEAGVNPNVKDSVDETPLSLCLWRSPNLPIVKLLLEHGAVILPRSNAMDTGHFLQFIMLCVPTDEEKQIIQLLVQHGSLINDPEAPGGRQALHLAAIANNCELIEVLVQLGANLFLTNSRNQTPKEFAQVYRCREAYTLLEQLESLNSDNMSQTIDLYEGEADTATIQGIPTISPSGRRLVVPGQSFAGLIRGQDSLIQHGVLKDFPIQGLPPKGVRVEGGPYYTRLAKDEDEEEVVEEQAPEEEAPVQEVPIQEVPSEPEPDDFYVCPPYCCPPDQGK